MENMLERGLIDAPMVGIFHAFKPMVHNHKVWKTIVLGTRDDVDMLKSKLAFAGCHMGKGSSAVMEQQTFTLTTVEMEFDLVKLSVRELGLTRGGYYSVIWSAALEQGLWRSPAPDIGPELRLQYTNQPDDEILRVPTMDGVTDAYGRPRLWIVMKHSRIPFLDISSGYSDIHFGPDERFVFVRPRKI